MINNDGNNDVGGLATYHRDSAGSSSSSLRRGGEIAEKRRGRNCEIIAKRISINIY